TTTSVSGAIHERLVAWRSSIRLGPAPHCAHRPVRYRALALGGRRSMRWLVWLRQVGERGWTLRGLLRRPWGGRGYAVAELPLWRWQESPVDQAIAAFVRRERRRPLKDDDILHVLHFATRSALRALRERNRQYLTDAF